MANRTWFREDDELISDDLRYIITIDETYGYYSLRLYDDPSTSLSESLDENDLKRFSEELDTFNLIAAE